MKLLHAGLLAVGAALAGGVAVWMTQPPAFSPAPPAVAIAPELPAPAPAVVRAVTPPPAQYQPPPEIASPPPVYAEPAHVEKPSPSPKPKPKPPTPAPAPAPIAVATVIPPPKPAPYEEPPVHKTPDPPPPVIVPKPAPTRSATLRPGYEIAVRLLQTLSADRAEKGDIFQGVLADPVVADGYVIAERGAPVTGRVVQVQNGVISLRLLNMETADGQRLEVSTEPWPIRLVSGQSVVRFRLSARIIITERKL